MNNYIISLCALFFTGHLAAYYQQDLAEALRARDITTVKQLCEQRYVLSQEERLEYYNLAHSIRVELENKRSQTAPYSMSQLVGSSALAMGTLSVGYGLYILGQHIKRPDPRVPHFGFIMAGLFCIPGLCVAATGLYYVRKAMSKPSADEIGQALQVENYLRDAAGLNNNSPTA